MSMATTAGTSSLTSAPAAAAVNPVDPTVTVNVNSSSHISTRPPSYGAIVLTLENVLIPPEKLDPSPSAKDGLDEETETFLRIGGCELIQTSGILLKLPQTAMATGQVLFQRFYYSKSFVRQPMETTAMACIYLASKIEEAPRRIRDVINVFHHIRQYRAKRKIQPLILDPAYIRLKSDVTLAERRILKELGFCVHVKHPHKIIVMYMKTLDYDQDARFVQLAWNYMNDALRTNVFVRFTPEAIACACIFLGARVLEIPLPNAPSWHLAFDVTDEDVMEISNTIMEIYFRPAINYELLEQKVDALARAYQDMKQRGKSSIALMKQPDSLLTPENTQSPESRPSSPQRAEISTVSGMAGIPVITITSASGKVHSSSQARDSDGYDKMKRMEHSNGDRDRDSDRERDRDRDYKRVQNHRDRDSPRGRKRRTPSPIIYNNSYRDDESPSRHKHKKRKKPRQSSSRSRSRSRSPRDRDRDRRSSKKMYSRDKSPSNARKHHKKKSSRQHQQRTRYSSSRSRSRSLERVNRRPTSSSKKSHYRPRSPSPQSYSPPRKSHSHLKSLNKKSRDWP